jgi:tripartite-type tricarboxylate transporter receptor subunit TctC
LQDLLGGQVQMTFSDLSVSLSNIKADKLRPLAITSKDPHPLLPGVPTLSKTLDNFELTTWMAMFLPANTPAAIVDKLAKATHDALKQSAVADQIAASGMRVQPTTSAELGAYVASETVKWAKYVAEAGVEPQ